jgi:hypothetical protein
MTAMLGEGWSRGPGRHVLYGCGLVLMQVNWAPLERL